MVMSPNHCASVVADEMSWSAVVSSPSFFKRATYFSGIMFVDASASGGDHCTVNSVVVFAVSLRFSGAVETERVRV